MLERSLCLSLLFCLAVCTNPAVIPLVHAGLDEAKAAYEKGDYATAYKELKPLAEQGDAEAQFLLGDSDILYNRWLIKSGVTEAEREAKRRANWGEQAYWLRKAAEQGHAGAQCVLGERYLWGMGVPKDEGESEKWFRKSAEQGYADAQVDLGKYAAKDNAEATKWFRMAAEQGNEYGQFFLAKMYANGQGAPQDLVQAHMWFDLAAARGNLLAENERDQMEKAMTPSEITEAQRLAREWKPKGKEWGLPDSSPQGSDR